eukprot:362015-Chlamydomonas_euryale.AAC.1
MTVKRKSRSTVSYALAMSSRTTAPPPPWARARQGTTKTSVRESRMSQPGRKAVCSAPMHRAMAWPKRATRTRARMRYRASSNVIGRHAAATRTSGAPGLGRGVMVPSLKPGRRQSSRTMAVKRWGMSGLTLSDPFCKRRQSCPEL